MVELSFTQGSQVIAVVDDRLYGNPIRLVVPEWFCARDRQFGIGGMEPEWVIEGPGRATGFLRGEEGSTAVMDVAADADSVAVAITLTNGTETVWEDVSDFCCWSFSSAPEFADYEMLRTWVWSGGGRKRVLELARPRTPRPLFLFYPVGDRTRLEGIGPLRNKNAFCSESLDCGAIAVTSRDASFTALLTSEETLFVFNNAEYACVHSCPCYGTIPPGGSATRTTRLHLREGDPEETLRP